MKITVRDRINGFFKRSNVASVNTYESIKSNASQLKYQDGLVRGTYHDFWDNYSRKEVALNDAVGNRITFGFMKHVLQKFPKFVENDEIQSEYIMDDVRQACEVLNIKPKFIIVGTNELINGWSLVLWQPQYSEEGLQNLKCKIFGREECHTRYWHRLHSRDNQKANKIYKYDAIYIPRPLGMESVDQTLAEERFTLDPKDPNFQHLTLTDRNYGYGYSRLQPIWDAITKLREVSNDEHFLKTLFMEVRYPQSWTATGKAQKYVEKARKANRRRGLATEAVTNPQTNEDTGLPSVQYRPLGQGPTGQRVDVNKASANLDGEWLRLLVNLGYSQMWATGGHAGVETGSEINLTMDDRADIAQFADLEPSFKKILEKLTQLGVMQALGVSSESQQLLLSKKYRMQCWLTWEYNDKAALQQEQLDHEMEMNRGESDDRNAFDKKNSRYYNYNKDVETRLLTAIRLNLSMPMTPVKSSWIKKIGYDEGSVYMQTHDRTKKGIDTYEYNPQDTQSLYTDWIDSGSKGGFWWDWVEGVYSPAFKHGKPPAYLETGFGEDLPFTQSEQTKEFKIEGSEELGIIGAGTTRAPFGIKDSPSVPYQAPDAMYTTTTTGPIDVTTTEPSIATSGYITDPGITGSKKVGPGPKRKRGKSTTRDPIIPYNPTIYNEKFRAILNSQSALLRFAKGISTDHNPTGWSMQRDTTYKIKELFGALHKHSTRVNRVSYGNSIKAGHPYNYGGADEFVCVPSYKQNIGKTVPLGIYHNLDNKGDINLPDWQVIGTHEVLGWDEELGGEIAKNNYDIDKIDLFFNTRNERNWIWEDYLSKNVEPPISGAYTCNVKTINDKNWQVNIKLKSMSFVPDGNCPWDICNFKVEEVNS